MKKYLNFAIAGMFVGFVFALASFQRYYVLYPDLDRALVYTLIGIGVIVVSFLYNQIIQLNNTLDAIEEHLADRGA